jgi:hypothetical protein
MPVEISSNWVPRHNDFRFLRSRSWQGQFDETLPPLKGWGRDFMRVIWLLIIAAGSLYLIVWAVSGFDAIRDGWEAYWAN